MAQRMVGWSQCFGPVVALHIMKQSCVRGGLWQLGNKQKKKAGAPLSRQGRMPSDRMSFYGASPLSIVPRVGDQAFKTRALRPQGIQDPD